MIDAVNQLQPTSDDALYLGWLPKRLPKNAKIVISTRETCISYGVMQQREFTQLTITELNDEECKALFTTFLSHYGKTLDEGQILEVDYRLLSSFSSSSFFSLFFSFVCFSSFFRRELCWCTQ